MITKEQLKKLTSDSAVYGVSNIVGRFITFLLVPFYTQFLPQSDYGIVAVVASWPIQRTSTGLNW